MKKTAIIIPIFNGIYNTVKCLDSLSKIKYKGYSVIVVDDGSTDRSSEIIQKNYPSVTVLKGNGSLWWSGAVNLGIKYAIHENYDYIVLLNNDNIVHETFLNNLFQLSEKNPTDIITSVVLNSKTNELIHAGGYSSKTGLRLYNKEFNKLQHEYIEVEWCGGMGVLIPKHIFEEIGFFNEVDFPQYYGDADFMFRARNEGYKILVCKSSIVWNNVDSSGLDARVNKFSDLKKVLTSIKSNNNLSVNRKFYKRYFSTKQYIEIMFYRYGYLFGGFIKRRLTNS